MDGQDGQDKEFEIPNLNSHILKSLILLILSIHVNSPPRPFGPAMKTNRLTPPRRVVFTFAFLIGRFSSEL
jgi:hypothetical protein